MLVDRRQINRGLVAGLAAMGVAGRASAQVPGFEIIAPAGPGGGYDQLARTVQQTLQGERLASGIQVINVPGAGGTIGLAQFVNTKRTPPGLMVAGLGLVGAVLLNKSPVSLKQTTPLARLTGEYQPLVVGADSPIKTPQDLIEKFRADPGSVSWGGFAIGSPDHILSGLVVKAAGGDVKKMNYIVTGAGAEMVPLIINNKVTVATGGYAEFEGHIKSGRMRAIGISAPERVPGIDVPTLREQGVDAVLVNWRGLVAPPGIGAAEKQAYDELMGKMVKSAAWKEQVSKRGWVDLYLDAAAFTAFLDEEQVRIAALLKDLGLA